MLVGADNQPVEIQPNPDSGISLPVHQIMLVVNGIHLLERMKLDELAARQVYEFAFRHAAAEDSRGDGIDGRSRRDQLLTDLPNGDTKVRRLLFGVLASLFAGGQLMAQAHVGQYEQADIAYGSTLYATYCVVCHGESGDLFPGVNLRSGVFRHAASDRDLRGILLDGIPGTTMVAGRVRGCRTGRAGRLPPQYGHRNRRSGIGGCNQGSGVVPGQGRLRKLSPRRRPGSAVRSGSERYRRDPKRGCPEPRPGGPARLDPAHEPRLYAWSRRTVR